MTDDTTKSRIRGRRKPDIIKGAKENNLREVRAAVEQFRQEINKTEYATGFTALQYAVARGNLSIVEYLLEQSEIDISLRDVHGRNSLELAVEVGHQGIFLLY